MRGFSDFCTVINATTFRRQAAAIFAAAPIESVCFQGLPPTDLSELLQAPELARIRGFFLHGKLGEPNSLRDPEAALLADCPYLVGLRVLSLYNNHIGDPGVRALAASPYLGRLRSLNLTQNIVGPDGLRALAHSASLPAPSSLDLYGNKLDDAGLLDLATAPLACQLRV